MAAVVVSQRAADAAVGSVLIIADDEAWATGLARVLDADGFVVSVDTTVDPPALRCVDVVLVDLGIGGPSAIAMVVAGSAGTDVPLLAFGDDGTGADSIAALAAGADGYVRRDAPGREVLARVRALRRRVPVRRLAPDATGDRATPFADELPAPDVAVLATLLHHPGKVLTRSDLALEYKRAGGGSTSLDLVVRRLRERLERVDVARRIVAVRGVGFRYDPPPP